MRHITFYFSILLFCCFAFFSCQKIALKSSADNPGDSISVKNNARLMALTSYPIVSADYIPQDGDSIERETVLGVQLTNPYLIPNMQQAYADLGLSTAYAVVNNLYVRFLPSNVDQLATLDSIMDAQGLELFDTPVDYQVLYEGDYYQDPSIPDSMITWQYAVVPPSFQFPAEIQHETLASIHIPGDDYTAVETEAERLASIQDSINMSNNTNAITMKTVVEPYSNTKISKVKPYVQQCGPGYQWSYSLNKCVPILCPPGSHLEGSLCVLDNPPVLDPPPPAPDAAVPAGNIYVHDTNLGTDVGVRKVRVVARRWFKIERTYTDNSGHYAFTKRFKHKVRILVKFKNDDAAIKNIRRANFWQMLFPVKTTLGIFSGTLSSINHTFTQFPDYSAKGNIYWTAATVHNAVQEYRDYAIAENIGLPPQRLKIFISRNGSLVNGGGATPMFAKRVINNITTAFVTSYLSSIVAAVVAVVKSQLDMVIDYKYTTNNVQDITQLLSDRVKETTYHELTHSAQYAALGNSWYTSLINAEEYENTFGPSGYKPYGDGSSTTYSPIIALGESWAEYIGQYFTDKKYGPNSSEDYFSFGGGDYTNNSPIDGFSSHLNVLENFAPNVTGAHFSWIPVGLFYDMMDDRNDNTATPRIVNIDDQVSGYSNKEFFNAFSSSITSLASYKANLLQQNANNQSTQVNSLFSQYGY